MNRECRAAHRLGGGEHGCLVHVEQRDFGAGRREGLGGGGADRAGGAGDRGDLAGERQFLGGAELRLLQRPVFAIEHVGFRNRLETADGLGVRDGLDRCLGEVGGNLGVFLGASKAEQAEPRHQHHTGQRIGIVFTPLRRVLCRAKQSG